MLTTLCTDNCLDIFISEHLGIPLEDSSKLAEELADYGISTPEQFQDSYIGEWDDYRNEATFAEDTMRDLGYVDTDNPLYSFIDWQDVWDHYLRYDTFRIDTFFFRNI